MVSSVATVWAFQLFWFSTIVSTAIDETNWATTYCELTPGAKLEQSPNALSWGYENCTLTEPLPTAVDIQQATVAELRRQTAFENSRSARDGVWTNQTEQIELMALTVTLQVVRYISMVSEIDILAWNLLMSEKVLAVGTLLRVVAVLFYGVIDDALNGNFFWLYSVLHVITIISMTVVMRNVISHHESEQDDAKAVDTRLVKMRKTLTFRRQSLSRRCAPKFGMGVSKE